MSRALETRNKERVEGKPVVVCHVSILLSRVHDASATTATGP